MADMYTRLSSSRQYVYNVARACDKGHFSAMVSCTNNFPFFELKQAAVQQQSSSCIDFPRVVVGLCWGNPLLC